MLTKPVKIIYNNEVVHTADSIQEAEEWIVECPDPNGFTIDATPEAIAANQQIVERMDLTDVPDEPALNHLERLRTLLGRFVDVAGDLSRTTDELSTVVADANAALDEIWGGDTYNDLPELREFDEIVSQGREALIDWIEAGRPAPSLVEPTKLGDDGKTFEIAQPMSALDALAYLRGRSEELIDAIGFGSASLAIPGIRDIMVRLDLANKVATPEEFDIWYSEDTVNKHGHLVRVGDQGFSSERLRYVSVSLDRFRDSPKRIPRNAVQLVAK